MKEDRKPSTPELIAEDQEILEEKNFRFLKHVNSLELHYMYTGYCSLGDNDSTSTSSIGGPKSSTHLL